MLTTTHEQLDFRGLSDEQITHYLLSHLNEFGDYKLSQAQLQARSIAIEKWEHGFAIVLEPHTYQVQLWWLYVDTAYRGKRLGRKYVRAILAKYGQEWRMSLTCDKKLRAFYSSFGFRVEERNGDLRTMMMKESEA